MSAFEGGQLDADVVETSVVSEIDDLTDESLDDDEDLDGGVVADDYDDDDDSDDDDDDDDYEDATDEDIDFVVALYREDGQPVATALDSVLANDLDDLIEQLRRLPGDAGATGLVSIAGEFFVIVRVRGRNVQVVLNDSVASNDWPIARDVVDFLGLEVADPDDDSDALGDLDIFVDQGVSEFDFEQIATNLDEDSDVLVQDLADKLGFGPQFAKALDEE